ncbi:MAG: cytochrome P450, partial [Mycobacterium sp.]
MDLAVELGPIYELVAPGINLMVVTGGDIVAECLDETRFEKYISSQLKVMRELAGSALFTSWTTEPIWQQGHNILLPAFGPEAIKGYTQKMADIASQLVLKWARLNPGDPVDVGPDMVRLTFDTVALVGLSYRPGSFYRQDMHPAVRAIEGAIDEALARPSRLPGQDALERLGGRREYNENLSYLANLADKIIRDRIDSGQVGEVGDVLDIMLTTADKASGKKLDLVNIRQQLITFLAAGYDTTSGLLQFTLYHVLKNPDVLAKVYAEVDEVFGDDLSVIPAATQIPKLKYLLQVMKEALRLGPNGNGFQVYAREDTVLCGEYRIQKGQAVHILTPQIQRNPDIFPDPDRFDPDRFTPEREAERPAWSWMPFGNGQRACIGRHFSFHEAQLLIGMILQRFRLVDSFDYQLELHDGFSVKPQNFRITVEPREGRRETILATPGAVTQTTEDQPARRPKTSIPEYAKGTSLSVLYGSNLGTSERIANEIAEDGRVRGFRVTLGALDDFTDAVAPGGAVVIVTSSYNGNPPDNAVKFLEWLRSDLTPEALTGVKYAVFGCGDRVWATTFQQIPAEVDRLLAAAGAERITERGVADASDDFDGMYRAWYRNLWSQVGEALGLAPQAEVINEGNRYEVETTGVHLHAPFFSSLQAQRYQVLENRELLTRVVQTGPVERSTRHIEFELPSNTTYRTGDHIALLPRNAAEIIGRAAAIANLNLDEVITVRANTSASSHLPVDTPFVVSELLAGRVELQEPVTRAQICTLAEFAQDPEELAALVELSAENEGNVTRYREEILGKRVSLLDLLERFPSIRVPLNTGLELLPALRPRYYSISSSPAVAADRCSITVGVLRAPSRSGSGLFSGTASNFLSRQHAGGTVAGFIRPP